MKPIAVAVCFLLFQNVFCISSKRTEFEQLYDNLEQKHNNLGFLLKEVCDSFPRAYLESVFGVDSFLIELIDEIKNNKYRSGLFVKPEEEPEETSRTEMEKEEEEKEDTEEESEDETEEENDSQEEAEPEDEDGSMDEEEKEEGSLAEDTVSTQQDAELLPISYGVQDKQSSEPTLQQLQEVNNVFRDDIDGIEEGLAESSRNSFDMSDIDEQLNWDEHIPNQFENSDDIKDFRVRDRKSLYDTDEVEPLRNIDVQNEDEISFSSRNESNDETVDAIFERQENPEEEVELLKVEDRQDDVEDSIEENNVNEVDESNAENVDEENSIKEEIEDTPSVEELPEVNKNLEEDIGQEADSSDVEIENSDDIKDEGVDIESNEEENIENEQNFSPDVNDSEVEAETEIEMPEMPTKDIEEVSAEKGSINEENVVYEDVPDDNVIQVQEGTFEYPEKSSRVNFEDIVDKSSEIDFNMPYYEDDRVHAGDF